MQVERHDNFIASSFTNGISNGFVDRNQFIFAFSGGKIYVFYFVAVDGSGNLQEAPPTIQIPRSRDAQMVGPGAKSVHVLESEDLIID